MDDLSLLIQNKWSVAILLISALLILAVIVSPRIRKISRRQEEELLRNQPKQVRRSFNYHFIGALIGAFIGVLFAFAVSGFKVEVSALWVGAIIGFVGGEIIGLAVSQNSTSES